MNIVFFGHPEFIPHQSMPRYAKMLVEGMEKRGHKVQYWFPNAYFSKLSRNQKFKKWLGYIDQYIIFPSKIKNKISELEKDTLFVYTDHALGPWVPITKKRPHIIHCHDFLAQRSSLGEIPENRIGWTGKKYQSFIKKGYIQGNNFISISQKTRNDLHRFLNCIPKISEVVYNGLNQTFSFQNPIISRQWIENKTGLRLFNGYLLHVGGNHFYKNRNGVIEIYDSWRKKSSHFLDLLLVGEPPNKSLLDKYNSSPFKSNIHFLSNCNDEFVRAAYNGAQLLIFPSIAEGFGWPIAEAMASGCPVITTDAQPMNEVAGNAGFFIPQKPIGEAETVEWTRNAAVLVENILNLSPEERSDIVEKGLANSERFDAQRMLDHIETIYKSIVKLK